MIDGPIMVHEHRGVWSLDVGDRHEARTLLEFSSHDEWVSPTNLAWQPVHTSWFEHPPLTPGTPAFDEVCAALTALCMLSGVADVHDLPHLVPTEIQTMLTAALKLHLPELIP